MGELTISRKASGITPLHLAGLAGLYLLIDAFGQNAVRAPTLSQWTCNDDSVTVRWTGPDGPALREFVQKAYVRQPNGLFWSPALGSSDNRDLARFYGVLVRAFVQHPRARTPDKVLGTQLLSFDLGDGTLLPFSYKALMSFAHRDAFERDKAFIDSGESLRKEVRTVGWLFPGGGVRHQVAPATELSEPADRAFALAFAPLGSIFYRVASRPPVKKIRSIVVLPLQAPLGVLAKACRHASGRLDVAAGAADALLQYEVELHAYQDTRRIGGAEAIILGTAPWNPQQQSRTGVLRVTGFPSTLDAYHKLQDLLPTRIIRQEKGDSFLQVAALREFVAANVIASAPWYLGFAEYLQMLVSEKIPIYPSERKAIHTMSRDKQWNTSDDLALIRTVHQAWKQTLGKLGERATQSHADAGRLFEVEQTRLRVVFAKTKTLEDFLHAFADFVSRAGSNPELRAGLKSVLRMIEPDTWSRARDLTLLGLVSYSSVDEEVTVNAEHEAAKEIA